MKPISLLIDENRGIYIPQHFVKKFNLEDWNLTDSDDDIQVLKKGPEHEFYWEAWENVLDKATYFDDDTQFEYKLHQDGSLYAVCWEAAEYDDIDDLLGIER